LRAVLADRRHARPAQFPSDARPCTNSDCVGRARHRTAGPFIVRLLRTGGSRGWRGIYTRAGLPRGHKAVVDDAILIVGSPWLPREFEHALLAPDPARALTPSASLRVRRRLPRASSTSRPKAARPARAPGHAPGPGSSCQAAIEQPHSMCLVFKKNSSLTPFALALSACSNSGTRK